MEKSPVGYQFGEYYLDIIHKTLWRSGQQIRINERGLLLLKYLCQASPEHISRQALTSLVWAHTVVSDASLSRLISDMRAELGDDAKQQKFIRTTKGVGFSITNAQPVFETPLYTQFSLSFWSKSQLLLTRYRALVFALMVAVIFSVFFYSQKKHQSTIEAINRIATYQENTFTAFKAQAARRNELVDMIENRLNIKRSLQYEKFFSLYFPKLTQQEKFVCEQIRAMTNTGLKINNQQILDELNAHPDIYEQIKGTKQLQQHLTFWLNKYHSVFLKRTDMCLLYVGVEDGVPYPSGVDKAVKNWLAAQ